MKITIELTSLEDVKAVVAALEGKNTQSAMALAPVAKDEAVKTEPKTRGRKPKETAVEQPAAETVEPEYVNENPDTGVEITKAVTIEPKDGDIDDATMREVGGKLLREMNANGKDGVGELTKILSSLSSKKVTEVPMNLRSRFLDRVTEALA